MERKSKPQPSLMTEAKRILKGLTCCGAMGASLFVGSAKADLPEIPVCIHPAFQRYPKISADGRIVVYSDERNGDWSWDPNDQGLDIYATEIDPNTGHILREFPICNDNLWQTRPSISGNGDIVVFEGPMQIGVDEYGGDMFRICIWGYKISTDEKFLINEGGENPDISENGRMVVWDSYTSYENREDIYGAEIDPNTGDVLRKLDIFVGSGYQSEPKVSENGDFVVWAGSSGYWQGIYGHKISEGRDFHISIHNEIQWDCDISENIVVWHDRRNGWTGDIYGARFDPNTCTVLEEFPICTAYNRQDNPSISKNFVVWEDYRNYPESNPRSDGPYWPAVYGHDLEKNETFEICTYPYIWRLRPNISNRFVVWIDSRAVENDSGELYNNYNSDVYMTKIPNEVKRPNPDLNLDGIVDHKDFSIFSNKWLEGVKIIEPNEPNEPARR